MKEIVVLSGTGGTGKTTIAGGLFSSLPRAIGVDADVSGANFGLILPVKPVGEEQFSGSRKATIGEECRACGVCAQTCRFAAINLVSRADMTTHFSVDQSACEGCRVCSLVCRNNAITFLPTVAGRVRIGETPFGPFFQSDLVSGGGNRDKLVGYLRRLARNTGIEHDRDFIVTDGPPGIGSSVIASMAGSDLVLLVTEPTGSGRADLERICQLVRSGRRPMAGVINKWDMHPEIAHQMASWFETNGVPVVGRLPYWPDARQSVAAGRPITDTRNSPFAVEMTGLARRVKELFAPQPSSPSSPSIE